jgi:hypothetical protein
MTHPLPDAEQPIDPTAARFAAKVRWLMLISGVTTVLAVAGVVSVIGYRVFKTEGSAAPADVTALLPKGARVLSTAVAADRIAVTVETAAGIEVHTFDVKTLKPAGRLRFAPEP